MTIFSRSTLKKLFADNPRAVAEFEKLDAVLSAVDDNGNSLGDRLTKVEAKLSDDGRFQRAHPVLDALTALESGKIGTVEFKEDGSAAIREIDSLDPASLLTRGVGYTVFVGLAGIGTTAQRPVVPPNAIAVYLDTTLKADVGQPILWNGSGWVDFYNAPV